MFTKKVNYPELIFNQKRALDRYFVVNQGENWQLSEGNECFVCNKFQYTLIFYNQGLRAENQGLIEIKDTEFVRELKNLMKLNYSDTNKIQPFIVGTVVQDRNYVRKLKMLRAELYAALVVSTSVHFVYKNDQSQKIKNGIVDLARMN